MRNMSNYKPSDEHHSKSMAIYLTNDEYVFVKKLMKITGQKKPSRFFMTAIKRLYNRERIGDDWATQQIIFLTRQKERIRQRREELDAEEEEVDEQLKILQKVVNDEENSRVQSETEND